MITYSQKNQGLSLCLTSFQPEIQGLIRRYSPVQQGNLWEDDIRQEAKMAIMRLVGKGKITPDSHTGALTDFERRVAYNEMRHAVHLLIVPMRSTLTVSASTLDKYRKLRAEFLRARPETDWEKTTANDILDVLAIPAETARNLLTLAQSEVRLDAPVSSSVETATAGDFLADDSVPHPAQKLMANEFWNQLKTHLTRLTPSQREVIIRRFGLQSGEEESCADIAKSRKSSRQSVDEQCRTALGHLLETFAAEVI